MSTFYTQGAVHNCRHFLIDISGKTTCLAIENYIDISGQPPIVAIENNIKHKTMPVLFSPTMPYFLDMTFA